MVLQPTSQLAIRRVELCSLPCTARGEVKLRTSPHWLRLSQLLTDRGVLGAPGRSLQLSRPVGLGRAAVSLPLLDIL